MAELTFFRQKRFDGGIRTGIEIDGHTVFENFMPGGPDDDPSLLWYIDVKCFGDGLPTEPEEVRRWFMDNGEALKEQLLLIANTSLSVGFDTELRPFQRNLCLKDISSKMIVTAIRRITAREISSELQDLCNNWHKLLNDMEKLSPV